MVVIIVVIIVKENTSVISTNDDFLIICHELTSFRTFLSHFTTMEYVIATTLAQYFPCETMRQICLDQEPTGSGFSIPGRIGPDREH